MKVYILQFEKKTTADQKMNSLIDFVNLEFGFFLEFEFILAYLYFQKTEPCINGFFQKIQIGTKDPLKKIEGMAWDLFHIRYLPMQVFELSESKHIDFIIKSILTKDKYLKDVINFNPIKRIIKTEDNINVSYQKRLSDFYSISSIHPSFDKSAIDLQNMASQLEIKLMSVINP